MTVISGDGVFSHACLGANDLEASSQFYDAALSPLGVENLGPFGDNAILYGKDKPALLILRPGDGGAPTSNGVTLGFAASSPAEVDAFHAAGLSAGGLDEGAPGPRGHLPNAYAAYLRDPAATRSAPTPSRAEASMTLEADPIGKDVLVGFQRKFKAAVNGHADRDPRGRQPFVVVG
jgi:catechol 2,3-dioxygenase-like lactoylglutathione lyase family enzyme